MKSNRVKVAILVVGALLMVSALAMALVGTGEEAEQKGVIQYKVLPVTSPMTQQQLQTLMTAQGNDGWRFIGPFAVGTDPIPNEEVFLFSKP